MDSVRFGPPHFGAPRRRAVTPNPPAADPDTARRLAERRADALRGYAQHEDDDEGADE